MASVTHRVPKLPAPPSRQPEFDVERVRKDFPILTEKVHGKPLVYLDNAATSQKPQAVLDALMGFYTDFNSNVHRGVHELSERATRAYEATRAKAQKFLNARETREIVFVRGTTEGINLVASSYGRSNLRTGDEVLVTAMEHHSNIVPWQIVTAEKGARLKVAPINDRGELIFEEFEKLLGPRTRIVAVTHVSNALGTVNPLARMVEAVRRRTEGAVVVVDGAQAAPHLRIDVRALDCDFYAFSGHKVFGPTGIGILYGKASLLEAMPPYQGGGDMIRSVTFEKTTYNDLPYKFEAGTPSIANAIGLGAALDYVEGLGYDRLGEYERGLLEYAARQVEQIPGVRLIGTAREKAGVLSFVIEGVHPHDAGTLLDQEGIAVRTGHHCAQPVMDRFGIPATTRASFAFYNTREEADELARGIRKVKELFA